MGSAEPAVATAVPSADRLPVPRRRLGQRVSAGHVVMVVAALLAVLLNFSVLRARDDTVQVAVAARDIPAGATVPAGAIRYAAVRVDDALLATLVEPGDLADLDGWVAAGPLTAGEPVRASDVRAPSAPRAQRAMSLPVPVQHAVGGALRPGDRIDVIEVRDGAASYVVTDAEVLDVAASEQRGIAALEQFSVTLAVDDRTALRLAAAVRAGTLDVVRSTGAAPVTSEAPAHDRSDPAATAPGDGR